MQDNQIVILSNIVHDLLTQGGQENVVRRIIHSNFYPYFLQKPEDMQEQFRANYEAHMSLIVKYCFDSYINSTDHLSIDFIRGLHKVLYHGIDTILVKTIGDKEEVMIPGEFKQNMNGISCIGRPDKFFICCKPEDAQNKLEGILKELHNSETDIFDRAWRFRIDFVEVHPFTDSNGKLALILCDLFLLKHDIHPPFFGKYKWENENEFYAMGEEYIFSPHKDLSRIRDFGRQAYEALIGEIQK